MSPINIPPPRVCPHCGGVDLESCEVRAGPHRLEEFCRGCRKHVRWLTTSLSPEEALAFVMPFGRYKYVTLEEIVVAPGGRSYLEWLVDRPGLIGRKIRRKVRLVLEAHRASPWGGQLPHPGRR
jgi:hypothetical protein